MIDRRILQASRKSDKSILCSWLSSFIDWIGLRENLQETIDFPIKYGGFPVDFPVNQSIDLCIA